MIIFPFFSRRGPFLPLTTGPGDFQCLGASLPRGLISEHLEHLCFTKASSAPSRSSDKHDVVSLEDQGHVMWDGPDPFVLCCDRE